MLFGIILIIIGIYLIISKFIKIKIHIWRIIVGILIIYFGLQILFNSFNNNSTDIITQTEDKIIIKQNIHIQSDSNLMDSENIKVDTINK